MKYPTNEIPSKYFFTSLIKRVAIIKRVAPLNTKFYIMYIMGKILKFVLVTTIKVMKVYNTVKKTIKTVFKNENSH